MQRSKRWFKLGMKHFTNPTYHTTRIAETISDENKQSFLNGIQTAKKRQETSNVI